MDNLQPQIAFLLLGFWKNVIFEIQEDPKAEGKRRVVYLRFGNVKANTHSQQIRYQELHVYIPAQNLEDVPGQSLGCLIFVDLIEAMID